MLPSFGPHDGFWDGQHGVRKQVVTGVQTAHIQIFLRNSPLHIGMIVGIELAATDEDCWSIHSAH